MDINTTVVVSVNGFLIIFFIYALLYVFRITPSKTTVPQRPEIREVIKSPISEIREVVEPPRPEISEVTKVMEPSPEVSEIIEPRLEVSEVMEVMEPSPEISEVMEPPIPEVTESMEPLRPEISEVTEVMEPSPEVSEIIEPRLEVSKVIEPPRSEVQEVTEIVESPISEISEVVEPPRPEASEVTEPPGLEFSEVARAREQSAAVTEVAEAEVTDVVEPTKPSQNIINVEGIGLIYAETLKKIGIETTDDLLLAGTTPQDREELAKKTGVSPKLILEWVNLVDLLRIKGVGEEYSDLLEEAGVDTVVELAKRNPEKLYNKLKQINEEKNLVNRVPFLSDVFSWVEQARALPRKVEY